MADDSWSTVGTVTTLWRYPVKSMAPEAPPRAELGWHGLEGDRRAAFVRPRSADAGFPWVTIRDQPRLTLYRPRTELRGRTARVVEVVTPTGETRGLHSPELADEIFAGSHAMRVEHGVFDSAPVSLVTSQTTDRVCELAGVPPDPLRFRPNIVIDGAATSFAEASWVGRCLAIGSVHVRVDRPDPRCVVIDVNPQTGARDAPVLRAAGALSRARVGVYAAVLRPGHVNVGDPVLIGPHLS